MVLPLYVRMCVCKCLCIYIICTRVSLYIADRVNVKIMRNYVFTCRRICIVCFLCNHECVYCAVSTYMEYHLIIDTCRSKNNNRRVSESVCLCINMFLYVRLRLCIWFCFCVFKISSDKRHLSH